MWYQIVCCCLFSWLERATFYWTTLYNTARRFINNWEAKIRNVKMEIFLKYMTWIDLFYNYHNVHAADRIFWFTWMGKVPSQLHVYMDGLWYTLTSLGNFESLDIWFSYCKCFNMDSKHITITHMAVNKSQIKIKLTFYLSSAFLCYIDMTWRWVVFYLFRLRTAHHRSNLCHIWILSL